MTNIIDRRLNPRDKTIKNRRKFINRSRNQIKEAVKDAIDSGNIADIEKDKIRVRTKKINEPQFRNDPSSGDKKYILPGNEEYVVGDTEKKPPSGSGQGGGGAGEGESEDDFEFTLDKEEFIDFIFEDLELPNLVKKKIKDVNKTKPVRSGFTNVGNPSQLDIVRSMKNSIGRRIGLGRPKNEEIEQLLIDIEQAERTNNLALVAELQEQLDHLRRRQIAIPWMDPFDVRYRNFTHKPQPVSAAVMFCIMDVSASMGQREKDLAKRFFFLLHMFLTRKYDKVEIVFIRHHESAKEVDEEEFFTSRESGGTIVSSALQLTKDIMHSRYNLDEWNVYVAQASDGDNFYIDNDNAQKCMAAILPDTQYFAYIEIENEYLLEHETSVWKTYAELADHYPVLNMRSITDTADIWKVFRDLFSKDKNHGK